MTRLIPLNSTTVQQVSNRVDPLLVLRGLSCWVVVLFHCTVPRALIVYQDYNLTWFLLGDGIVAVWVFFCLSGYLMGKVFYTQRYTPTVQGITQFLLNRALRIFPLYYFAILIQAVFVYPEVLKPENWSELLRLLTFTYTLPVPIFDAAGYYFNGAFWTLSTEFQFYLIIPFIFVAFQPFLINRFRIIFTLVAIIGLTTGIRIFGLLTWPTHTALLMNLDVFLCGFLVNAWCQLQQNSTSEINGHLNLEKRFKLNLQWVAVMLLIVLYLATAYHGYHEELWNYTPRPATLMGKSLFRTVAAYFIWPVLTGLVTAFFIYTVEKGEQYQTSHRNQKLSLQACLDNPARLLEIFGVLSYGIYIWHMPIIQQIDPVVQGEHSLETYSYKLMATIILSIIMSIVTYYIIEIPAARLKKYSVKNKS